MSASFYNTKPSTGAEPHITLHPPPRASSAHTTRPPTSTAHRTHTVQHSRSASREHCHSSGDNSLGPRAGWAEDAPETFDLDQPEGAKKARAAPATSTTHSPGINFSVTSQSASLTRISNEWGFAQDPSATAPAVLQPTRARSARVDSRWGPPSSTIGEGPISAPRGVARPGSAVGPATHKPTPRYTRAQVSAESVQR